MAHYDLLSRGVRQYGHWLILRFKLRDALREHRGSEQSLFELLCASRRTPFNTNTTSAADDARPQYPVPQEGGPAQQYPLLQGGPAQYANILAALAEQQRLTAAVSSRLDTALQRLTEIATQTKPDTEAPESDSEASEPAQISRLATLAPARQPLHIQARGSSSGND